jgi:serine protease Do
LAANATPTPEAEPEAPAEQGGVAQSGLGLSVRPITPPDRTRLGLESNENGLVVTSVEPTSDAAQKGIGAGDVILQAGGRSVRTAQELSSAVETARRANRPILLQVASRGGRGFVAVDIAGS